MNPTNCWKNQQALQNMSVNCADNYDVLGTSCLARCQDGYYFLGGLCMKKCGTRELIADLFAAYLNRVLV